MLFKPSLLLNLPALFNSSLKILEFITIYNVVFATLNNKLTDTSDYKPQEKKIDYVQ